MRLTLNRKPRTRMSAHLASVLWVITLAAGLTEAASGGGVVSWPAPAGEALSDDYEVSVAGQAIPVYACRVSAMPFNQVWPGYQRPLDQTELAGFASWEMTEPVKIVIRPRRPVRSVVVRPTSLNVPCVIGTNGISLTLNRPSPVVVEVNGPHHALHLFANPPQVNAPSSNSLAVRYFAPGVHHVGRIELKSNERVHIAGGAVVYGYVAAQGATNIQITGRGILDVSPYARGEAGGAVRLADCSNVTVEGLVMRDPDVWCCSLFGCRNVTITNVKLVGLWRYNADGIDICNSQDVSVGDCFVRAFDDALVIKGLKFAKGSFDARPVKNVRFKGCVVWCDWGRAMEIGAETCAPEIANIVFEDCDIVRTTHIAMDIQHGDRAAIHDIRFENIRVEIDAQNPQPLMQNARDEKYSPASGSRYSPTLMEIVIRKNNYSHDDERGTVRDVLFKDVSVFSAHAPPSSFRGYDAEHGVDRVTITNLRFNGQAASNATAAQLRIGPEVRSVQFANETSSPKGH